MRPEEIIKKLNLIPLADEGGYFRRTWVSDITFEGSEISSIYEENKPFGTAIYYLLINSYEGFSALHALPTPEIYHFYLGDSVQLSLFHCGGKFEQIILGQDILSGEVPQYIVPAGTIQGSCIVPVGEWALIGTTMAPGFTDRDFSLSSRKEMLEKYPENSELIISLTRD